MTEITYTRQGDYNLPNLLPPQEEPVPHGKYALRRKKVLKEHRRVTYTNLLTSEMCIRDRFRVTVTKSDVETGAPQGDGSLAGATYGLYKGCLLYTSFPACYVKPHSFILTLQLRQQG